MEIRNLTSDNLEAVEGLLKELNKENPVLRWKTFPLTMDEQLFFGPNYGETVPPASPDTEISALREELVLLRQKIELIFGGYVLLDGRFVKLYPQK